MLFTNKKHTQQPSATPLNDGKTHVFNLIILDESGSMAIIENAARNGCNEVLSGIRKAQKNETELVQHVSLLPFSTGKLKYIFNNETAEKTHDIGQEYSPSGCTALYDAMGFSLTALEKEVDKYEDAIGLVTVITDGEENSSVEYSGKAIYELVERLKKKGWTFAFMGANQDVMKVAQSLNINNAREFEYTEDGMTGAFDQEVQAKGRFWDRLKGNRKATQGMSREDRQAFYAQVEKNTNYYDEK